MTRMMLLAIAAALPAGALAAGGGFDGKSELICTTIEAVQCLKAPGRNHVCARGLSTGLDVPQFIRLDFAAKRVTATEESGVKETSDIASVGSGNNHLVVQGIDDGHGWSIVIEQKTGQMSASAVGDEEGVLVFGACTKV